MRQAFARGLSPPESESPLVAGKEAPEPTAISALYAMPQISKPLREAAAHPWLLGN